MLELSLSRWDGRCIAIPPSKASIPLIATAIRDARRVLANLRFNVETNRHVLQGRSCATKILVRPLDWTDYASVGCGGVSSPSDGAECGDCSVELKSAAVIGLGQEFGRSAEVQEGAVRGDRGCELSGAAASSMSCRFSQCSRSELCAEQDDSLGKPEVLIAADVVYDARCEHTLDGLQAIGCCGEEQLRIGRSSVHQELFRVEIWALGS